ncbi:MAG: TolC family protein [Gemmatimonadota bacterium]
MEQALDREIPLPDRPTPQLIISMLSAGALLFSLRAEAQAPATLVLTRTQAVDSALAHNPALVVLQEQVSQARARKVQSTAFPDPTLSVDYAGQSALLKPGTNSGGDIAVGVTVPFPYKFHLLGRVGQADVDAAAFTLTQAQQQTAALTVQAYDALLVALQHRDDLTEGKQLAEQFLAKTKNRFDAGTVARIDVLKAEVDLAAATNALIANTRDLANARSALDRLLGRALGAPVEAADSLTVPPSLPSIDTLIAMARTNRPELQSLASQQRGAASATTLAKEFWLPDLQFGLAKNYADGGPPSYTTGVGITVPLFFWNHTRGEVAETKHRELELVAAYRDQQAGVDQDVRQAYANAATAAEQGSYLRDQLLPEARRVYEITLTSYGIGGSSALDVLDARRTLLDALSQYADALGAANDARADLERAVGGPVPPGDSNEH